MNFLAISTWGLTDLNCKYKSFKASSLFVVIFAIVFFNNSNATLKELSSFKTLTESILALESFLITDSSITESNSTTTSPVFSSIISSNAFAQYILLFV